MKRILFVDDERPLLDGLRSRLYRLSSKWDMEFVQGGAGAIEHMRTKPFDVIVTDMRMPEMDGARLLEQVCKQWPETIRIILSGQAELEQTARLVPFAHQYLTKPCQPHQLENVIERCLLLHEVLADARLRAIVGRIRKLPSLPGIYLRLQNIVSDERITLSDVAKIVSADSAIAARVLQIVNSAFYRLPKRITNIEQAVSYLGFKAIRNLAMSVEIFSSWPGSAGAQLDLTRLQAHAHAVAAAAAALTAKTPIADDAILAALLHDIGYWVLAQECPGELDAAAQYAVSEGVPLFVAETHIIGASHAEVGAYLLGIWGLPYSVVEAVAHHHRPERVRQLNFDILAALVMAHALAPGDDASVFGSDLPSDPTIDEPYLLSVEAPFDWAEASGRVNERTATADASVT